MPRWTASGRRWTIFVITAANFFLSQFYRATNAVIAPQLTADLGLDTADLGLLSAAFFYAFALTQIPISLFLDRVGARKMITGLSLVGIAGAGVFAASHSLGMGVLGRALLGVGMGCNLMGALKLMTAWFSPRYFATLSGVMFAIGTMGNMAATTPLVLLVERVGWRFAFVLVAGLNLALVAVLCAVVRDAPVRQEESGPASIRSGSGQASSHFKRLLKSPDFWIISMGAFVGYGIFAAFQTLWAGPYLMEVMGLSPRQTGNIIFLLNLGMIAGSPLWGGVSDRIFPTRKWIIVAGLVFFSLMTGTLALLPAGTAFAVLAVLIAALGVMRASGQLMYTHIKERMPVHMAGSAMAGVNFFTMTGPAAFLQGIGVFMQTAFPGSPGSPEAFGAALLLCSGFLGITAAVYCFSHDSGNGRKAPGDEGFPSGMPSAK